VQSHLLGSRSAQPADDLATRTEARHFLQRHAATRPLHLSATASQALMAHDWPGNVRELERLMERAVTVAASDIIELEDLPLTVSGDYAAALAPSIRRNDSLRAWASRYARLVLDRCDGNKREACRTLDISYHTLQSYLRFPVLDSVDAGSATNPGGAIEAWPDEADPSGPMEVQSVV